MKELYSETLKDLNRSYFHLAEDLDSVGFSSEEGIKIRAVMDKICDKIQELGGELPNW